MGLNLTGLRDAVAKHGRVTRVLIADHKGSTPRETGASMLVWQDGQSDTIGGGTLEYQAVDIAHKTANSTALNIPLGPALGQCCGGSVTLVLETFTPANLPQDSTPFIRQITGSTPQPLALQAAKSAVRSSGNPAPFLYQNGWLCEPIDPTATQLWLYGAGHVGRAIVEALNGLPFDIIWVDTHADRFPTSHTDNATPLVAANPADAPKHAPKNAHHLVLTYSHALDLELCHRILAQPHASLGLIGSKTKRARFTKRLSELGHPSTAIANMICPIGNRTLGKEPKAIALGVATELLYHSQRRSTQQEATA
jgi:xanthine dehydrogenase accessory factor